MPRGRIQKRLSTTAVAVVSILSILLSVVFGGHKYFYCVMMGAPSLDSCCAQTDESANLHHDEGSAIREECCATKHLGKMAPASPLSPEPSLEAPLSAVLPSPAAVRPPVLARRATWAGSARDGPPDASARDHLLKLMISLT